MKEEKNIQMIEANQVNHKDFNRAVFYEELILPGQRDTSKISVHYAVQFSGIWEFRTMCITQELEFEKLYLEQQLEPGFWYFIREY